MNLPQNDNLQTMCLKCITSNFERFYSSFYSPVYENLSSGVKLLQKVYSDRILKMLADGSNLKNEHLSFVINKYTKQLNLHYLTGCDFCAIEERLEEVGSVITMFSMAGIQKFYHSDIFLRHLSRIQVLELAKTNCSDSSVAIIAENCNALKSLDLYGCCKVTDKGLSILCQKEPPLESLNVEYTSVTYKGVALVLQTIPSLTKLEFENMPRAIFEATGLNDSLGISNNRVFNLSNLVILNNPMRPENHLTAILNACTVSCPKTKDLVVSEILTKEQLSLVSTFDQLEMVRLQCSTIVSPKLCINDFLGIRGDKLTVLSLTSFSLSVELLANHCPNLECLSLQYPTFEDMSNSDVVFPRLKMFNLQNASLYDIENQISSTCIISSSPNLQELHLVHCQFSDEMREVILHCPTKLYILNFSNTIVSAEFIEEILRLHTNLIKLVLDNSGISSTDYDDLMDIVDDMESKVYISWADYSEAIRELFCLDDSNFNSTRKRYILKL